MRPASEFWRLHPIWITALGALGMFAPLIVNPIVTGLILTTVFTALLLWVRSIYSLGRKRLIQQEIPRPDRRWVFLLASGVLIDFAARVGFEIAGATIPFRSLPGLEILEIPLIVGFFATMGLTAFEICYAERGERPSLFSDGVVGRFFALFYFMIGAWWLRPRLLRMAA